MKSTKKFYAKYVVSLLIMSILLSLVSITAIASTENSLSSLLKINSGCTVNGKYLIGVDDKTTSDVLLAYFNTNNVTITSTNKYVGTGSKVKLLNGNITVDELTVVVSGDTNGDGQINASDYLRIKRAVLGTYKLENEYLLAALPSGGTSPSAKDYLFVKRHFLGTYNIYNGGYLNYNNTKIAYIPLDDRPVNVDRAIYLAKSAGYELIMPKIDYCATKLDGNGANSNGTKYGNREELLKWLKEVDAECDYFVISLDQILSGGLVNSRVQKNTDLSYEYKIIDYLIELNKNNKVYFFDSVMRLASTVNYNGYGGEEYNILRNYGSVARKTLSNSDLTVEKIIDEYKYNTSGAVISSSLSDNEIDDYLSARARKLKLTDYFLTKGSTDLNYCYIGVDDSNPSITVQSNEINYIKSKLNNNGILFAGCDELGMMSIARLTSEQYSRKLNVSVAYFGGSANYAADSYDIGTLKNTVEDHLKSINTVITNSDKSILEVLVLTKPRSLSLSQYSNSLLDRLEQNMSNKKPTIIIDASTNNGTLQSLMVQRQIPLSTLLGYSNWNTVGNAVGIAVSQGVTRCIYLKSSVNVTHESNVSFLKSMTFAYVKDINYKIGNYAATRTQLLDMINNSEVIINVNKYKTQKYGIVSISNYRYPWNRSFEASFTIYVK